MGTRVQSVNRVNRAEFAPPYCFAAFIRPQLATCSIKTYREQFQSSALASDVDEPQEMIAVKVVCTETDEEAVA